MRSPLARAAIAVGAIAAVVVLFVVLAGGDDNKDSTTTTQAQTTGATGNPKPAEVAVDKQITIRNGKPVGGVKRLDYKHGDQIRFVVTSDVADEVHVHGFDIPKDVPAGGSVRFSFPANIEGVFEVELEQRKEPIAELRVSP